MVRFLNRYSKWLLPQLILYHPKYVKLQWILRLQNPYLNWVLPLSIFAQQGQGVYTQLPRLDRLDKRQVLERCSCGGGT